MDEGDRSVAEQEILLELFLAERKPGVQRTGHCLFCGDSISAQRIFCDNGVPGDRGCADDYERGKRG